MLRHADIEETRGGDELISNLPQPGSGLDWMLWRILLKLSSGILRVNDCFNRRQKVEEREARAKVDFDISLQK